MSGKSNHYDAMVAIQSIIQGIGLTGISRAPIIQEVLNYKTPDVVAPCVLIAPFGPESYDESAGLNDQDAPVYGIAIAIVADADNQALNLEDRLQWRQQIRRRMKNQSLSGLPQNFNLDCRPMTVVEPRAWNEGKFVSGFLVMASFQEPRS
jgi:hypothetical protein